MDHLRMRGFLVLLFTTLFAIQFAETRVLDDHIQIHKTALSQHNSADLDDVPFASSRPNYTTVGGHVRDYSESNTESSSGNSTHAANNTTTTVSKLLQKEGTAGDGNSSKAPAGIKEVTPIEGNADILYEMLNDQSSPRVHGGMEDNILSASGQSPGVGHWEKSKSKSKHSTSLARTPNNVLSSGPSPGVGNGHTSAIAGAQSELGSFNKLPSGSSPGAGHKVTDGYREMAQESESKKSAMMMNILSSGSSPGLGHSATNGRNMMEKIRSKKKIAFAQKSESKKKSPIMNILPSGPSPGVGNSATNRRDTMEKISKEDEEGMGIQTIFNRLPSGSSPGVGHSYTNAHLPDKIQTASEDRKGSGHTPIFHKLPGGPSPGGGHSYVEKSALTVRMEKGTKYEEGMGIQTFNRLPSDSSPGVGHSYTNAHLPDKIQTASASEDTMVSDHTPMFHKLPGGPSPGGGHSYVEKSSSTVRMQLSSHALRKISSGSPSPGDGNSSSNKLKLSRRQKKKVDQTARALADRKIGCDGGGLEFYGMPNPPMFGIAAAESS